MASPVQMSFRIAADISQFKANLQQAVDQIETTKSAMQRMTNALDGSKLIADANAMVLAIDKIGGVSSLTASEQARVNTTVTAAIEKYQALGGTAPPALLQIAEATNRAGQATNVWSTEFSKLTAAFSVGAVISQVMTTAVAGLESLGRGLLTSADSLVNLSNKTGLSTATLQQMDAVARESGTDVQAFADAAFKMGVNVANGTQLARKAAQDLGLDWQQLRAMNPDQQFNAVVTALAQMEDAQKRNADAVALFGRGAKEVVSALANDYEHLASTASVAGEAQIRALKDTSDALDRLQQRTKAIATDVAGSFIEAGEQVAKQPFWKTLAMALDAGPSGIVSLLSNASQASAPAHDVVLHAEPGAQSNIDLLKAAEAGYRALTAAQKDDIAAAIQLGKSNNDIVNELNITDGVLALAKKAYQDHEAAVRKSTDAVKAMVEALTGSPQKATALTAAVAQLGGVSKLTQPELERLTKQADDLVKQGAELPPAILQATHAFDVFLPKVETGIKDFKDLGTAVQLRSAIDTLQDTLQRGTIGLEKYGFAGAEAAVKIDSGFDAAVKAGEKAAKAADEAGRHTSQNIQEMARGLEELGSAIGGTVGTAISDIGHMVSAVESAVTAFGKMDKFNFSNLVAGIGAIAGIAAAAIGPMESLFNHFFGTAGRDAVTQFANSMGGFDALHTKLDALGASGEQLWINLTQGVGRNNPQQAQTAIDAINKALGDQKSAEDALRQSQNSQMGDLISKIQAFGGAIDPALDPYITKLQQAGILTDANAASLKALEGSGGPTYETLQQLQQKYNLTAAQMGPSFQTQQIDANFQTIIDDLDTLTRGGADLTTALFTVGSDGSKSLSGLGKAVDDDIEAAIKAGVQIPANLEPAAKALFDQGDLVDANGKKITDFNTLSFGETMQTSLDNLNKTLKDLIDKLANGMPAAIKNIPSHVDITFTGHKDGTWPGDSGGSVPGAATGGIVTRGKVIPFPSYYDLGGFVPRGTDTVPAMLTPGEVVLNAEQQRRLLNGGSGDITIELHHQTVLDGKVIDERIERVSARNAATGKLRMRAAHGRSY